MTTKRLVIATIPRNRISSDLYEEILFLRFEWKVPLNVLEEKDGHILGYLLDQLPLPLFVVPIGDVRSPDPHELKLFN